MKNSGKAQIRQLFGLALTRLITFSMTNHIYTFKDSKRIQISGGATGYDETGELADLVMLWWDMVFADRLRELDLTMDLFVRFKDDLNIIGE